MMSTSDSSSIIAALQYRASTPARCLVEPAPDAAALDTILQAAMSAPDHGAIRPWRFAVLRAGERVTLGRCYAASAKRQDPAMSDEQGQVWIQKCTRAPMVIVVAAKLRTNIPKVPTIEQISSTAVAAQHIQLAANALGYGSVWVTGPHCNSPEVKTWLKLADNDHIVAVLHIGTPTTQVTAPKRPEPEQFLLQPGH